MHSTPSAGTFFSIMLRLYVHQLHSLFKIVIPSTLDYIQLVGGIQLMVGTTQGDPVAMVIYAIAIIPLILMLVEIRMQNNMHTKRAAYADDLTVAGPINQLRTLWNTLCRLGPKFRYFPEGSKSWTIVRGNAKEQAQAIFDNTKIKITTDGQRHLGAVIGTTNFKQNYIKEKISQWILEVRILSKITWYDPQAAYLRFITVFKHNPTYSQ